MKKILYIVMSIALMLGMQGCHDDTDSTVEINSMVFEAENLSIDTDKKIVAIASPTQINYNVSITVNGITIPITLENSNQLPVLPGNEIEVRFQPSHSDETGAQFTFPDGTTQRATTEAPNVKWIVPDNVTTGMEIKGESWDKEGKKKYKETGKITLIKVEI